MAARTRSGSPVVIPPSIPPARAVRRRSPPSAPRSISSCAWEPRRDALSKPSPTSTPLMAWMPISAPASRESSRRSQWTWLPSPGGSPYASTSTTPPRVSPSFCAASISATMAALAAGSRQRTGSASSRADVVRLGPDAVGSGGAADGDDVGRPAGHRGPGARNACATAPRATRAAVSRALARSSTGRASSNPYFCIPARSAWPGRGRVSGALRARPARVSAGTGSALMTCSHFGHSVLPIRTATGPPWVRPCRTPPSSSTSSRSKVIRAPLPWPRRRRASASARSSVVTATPAGSPSRVASRAGPCDSPAVSQRSMRAILARGPDDDRWPARSPGRPPGSGAGVSRDGAASCDRGR